MPPCGRAPRRASRPTPPIPWTRPTDWSLVDAVVVRAGTRWACRCCSLIEVTPRWGGRGGTANKAPVNMASLQAFAYAAADPLQRPAHRALDGASAAGRDALGGLERAQHDEPPEAAVQLPLHPPAVPTVAGDLRHRILTANYKGVDPAGSSLRRGRRRNEAELLGAESLTVLAPLRFALLPGKKHPPLDVYSRHLVPHGRRQEGRTNCQGRTTSPLLTSPRLIQALDTAFPGQAPAPPPRSSACRPTRRTAPRASAWPISPAPAPQAPWPAPPRARTRASTC